MVDYGVICSQREKGGIRKKTSNLYFRQFNSVSFSIFLQKIGINYYLFIFVFVLGRLIRVSRGDWIGV